jgi:hypothetical protein
MAALQGHPDRSGINRHGEKDIRPDYYEDQRGIRHHIVTPLSAPVEWSRDPRSESSREKSYHGKGPRNFSRSDELLREEVCEAFLLSRELDPEHIDVEVNDAVVILRGRVRRRLDRYLAEDLASEVSGVREIVNQITRETSLNDNDAEKEEGK